MVQKQNKLVRTKLLVMPDGLVKRFVIEGRKDLDGR